MPSLHTVASWKEAKERQKGAVDRPPMNEAEIALAIFMEKHAECVRLQYMAINNLKMKNGSKPGWPAYYFVLKQLKALKAEFVVKYLNGVADANGVLKRPVEAPKGESE